MLEASLLIEAVRYESYEMPPKGKLPERDIEIRSFAGSTWEPRGQRKHPRLADAESNEEFDLEKRKSEFWVWQPIAKRDPPERGETHAWPRSDIDRHILARLEEAGLKPSRRRRSNGAVASTLLRSDWIAAYARRSRSVPRGR